MDHKSSDLDKNLCGLNYILKNDATCTYDACIAGAILIENDLQKNMCDAEISLFMELALNISQLIFNNDEPRFTLYDYLDACVNTAYQDWMEIAAEINCAMTADQTSQEAAFDHLIRMAIAKRETYSL